MHCPHIGSLSGGVVATLPSPHSWPSVAPSPPHTRFVASGQTQHAGGDDERAQHQSQAPLERQAERGQVIGVQSEAQGNLAGDYHQESEDEEKNKAFQVSGFPGRPAMDRPAFPNK